MEQLKIAQFYNNLIGSKAKKTELLKKVDVNYCIPDTLADKQQIRTWSGYTSLHFAVKRNNLELAKELLKQGADLMKQGTKDGYTPLHIAVNSTSFIRKSLYEMSGLLQEYQMINTLLSKQVELKNISNPTSKNGVSHLHIACIVNHTEAVVFFAKAKESLSLQIGSDMMHWWPGFTPLHCAIKYSSVEAADILLRHGADVHIKNAKGMSCVHLLVDRILDMTDFITMGKRTNCVPYEEEIERIESIIKLVLKATANGGIFVDDTGLSTLHVASTLRDQSMLKDFIKQDIDVNMPVSSESKFWPGWTPLHFAACSNIETMKLLVQNGADITIKNLKGETALDLCAKRFTAADIQSILSMTAKDIMLSDNTTKLSDLLSVMDDYDKFSDFLQKLEDINIVVPSNSPNWPGYNLLHLSVSLNEKTKLWKEFERKFDMPRNADTVHELYNCTEDEEVLYGKRIELCLEKNCSVSTKNTNGQTPIHLAFATFKDAITEKLLLQSKDNVEDQNGLSHLHIACALGKLDVVERYVEIGANVNGRSKVDFDWHERWYDTKILINVRANSTPLHVAVLFGHRAVVEYLLQNNADVYAQDSLGLTPIHLLVSTCNRPRRLAQMLFDMTPNLRDSVSLAGLSHLHVAAWANSREAVDQLLLAGARVDRVVEVDAKKPGFLARLAGKTALHVALDEDSEAAVKPLLRAGANVHAKDSRGISALQHSMCQLSDSSTKHFVRMLKTGRCELEPTTGMTLLHVACGNCEIKWAKRLLKRGADVNARIREGKLQGATPLYVLVQEASFLDNNAPRLAGLVRMLLNNGADVSVDCGGRTPLHLIYESVFVDFFLEASDDDDILDEMGFLLPVADLLLKNHRSYDVNPTNHQGFSHFHFACLRNDVETVRKFLDHGVDVNEPIDPFADDSDGFTPLHFAMAHRGREVAYLLLERGADVNAEDANGNKPLHAAIKRKFVDLPLIEAMLSRGADIHAKNVSDETPLYCLLKSGGLTLEALEFFLDRGCYINIMDTTDVFHQGIIGLAMRNAAPTELQAILERLLQVCEVKRAIEDGFNVIESIVAIDQNGELSVDDYLKAIEMLMNVGCDVDQQDSEGTTALHEAVSFYNLEAIDALLQLGADINVVNNENECPFVDKIIDTTEYDESREMDVVKALASHLWKMRFIELEVRESNLSCLEKAEKQFPLVTLLEQSCQDELTKAKETEIYQGLSVKHFLSELGAVAEYPRMCPIRRGIVDKYFKSITDVGREFPQFCGLLVFQYKKTCARMELWQPAKEAIASICQFEIPDLCVEAILRYFTSNEMKCVIELVEKLFNYA